MDDLQAIQILKNGEIGGLEVLVARYQLKAIRAAFLVTHDQTLAEDAVQESFMRIYRRIHQFDMSRPFEPYFLRSVVNASLNAVKKSNRHLSLDGDVEQVEGLLAQAVSVESDVEYIQMKQRIIAALARLEPRQRAVVVQRYYLEMSEKEMSAALDIPSGTVKWLLNAARAKLRNLLAGKENWMNKKSYKDILDSAANDSLSRNSDLWPKLSAQLERNSPMMTPRTRPVVAILLTLLTLLVLSGAAYALGRTLGYLPGIGLVNNTSGLRVLAEPIAVTRDGVTLVISSAFVYPDRVELVYAVNNLAPEDDSTKAADATTNPTAFCGGVNIGNTPKTEGDARLQLPDGTVLQRDQTGKYPQNVFATNPVYAAIVPGNLTKMTLVLDCLPFARRGAVPEHWSVPFELKSVPAGTVIGAPVIEVNVTSAPVAVPTIPTETAVAAPVATAIVPAEPAPVPAKLTFTMEQAVQTANGPVFYLQLHVENPAPEMVVAFPRDVYVIDSQGQKIQYMNNLPYSEDPATVWEYVPTAKPAAGPLRLVLNDAVMKFAPLNQATFSFDAGQNPQYNQTWAL